MFLPALGRNPRPNTQDPYTRVLQSPQYREGTFHNSSETPVTLPGVSFFSMLRDFLNKPANTAPASPLPSLRTDLRALKGDAPTLVWFAHSSYYIVSRGTRILVDPVFSGNAGPASFIGKAFPGSDAYTPADFDNIDILLLTHDHYDHLDYPTVRALHPKVKHIVTALGVGAHLRHWGVSAEKITELDWLESTSPLPGVTFTAAPARHFSGRGLSRGKTLWASFVLQLHGHKLYLGGDSGYDAHFKAIGAAHGPFDLAILEAGQYGKDWPYIHLLPEETVQAAVELSAKALLPVHWAKFALAYHPWQESIERVLIAAEKVQLPLLTPRIGEAVPLTGPHGAVQPWWRAVL